MVGVLSFQPASGGVHAGRVADAAVTGYPAQTPVRSRVPVRLSTLRLSAASRRPRARKTEFQPPGPRVDRCGGVMLNSYVSRNFAPSNDPPGRQEGEIGNDGDRESSFLSKAAPTRDRCRLGVPASVLSASFVTDR